MRRGSQLWILFCCQAVMVGGLALSFPFLALYLHRERGAPMSLVGACLAFVLLTTALSQGWGGELSDLVGRKRVMVFSLWSRVLSVLGLAWAMSRGWPFVVIVGFHLLSSFLGVFYDPAMRGWVADHTDAQERVRAYGFLRVAINLGWAVGPALGGFMAQRSYPLLFVITACVCALCAGFVTFFIQDKPGVARSGSFEFSAVLKAGADPRFLRFCVFSMVIAMVMAQLVISMSVHAMEYLSLSESQVGLLFSLNGLLVVALQYPLSAWWSRFRLSSALIWGSLLYAFGYLCVGFSGGFATLAGAITVVSLGEITVSPGLHALAANMAPASERGRFLGFAGFLSHIGSAMGPMAGGIGLQYLSPLWIPIPWIAVAFLGVCAAVGFRSLQPALRKSEEGLPAHPAPLMDAVGLSQVVGEG